MSAPVRKPTVRELQIVAHTALKHILDAESLPDLRWSLGNEDTAEPKLTGHYSGADAKQVVGRYAEDLLLGARVAHSSDLYWTSGIHMGCQVRVIGAKR